MPADIKKVITEAQPYTRSLLAEPAPREIKAMYDMLRDVEGIIDRAITEGDLGSKIARYFGKEFSLK